MKSIFVRVFMFSLVFLAFCYLALFVYMKIRFPLPSVDFLKIESVIEENIKSYDTKERYQKKENNIYLMIKSLNFIEKINSEFFDYLKDENKAINSEYEEIVKLISYFPPNALSKIEIFDNFKLKATFEDIKQNGFAANFGDYISYMKYNRYWLIVANRKFKEQKIAEALEIIDNLYKISFKLLETKHFFPTAMGINLKLEISKTLLDNILKNDIEKESFKKVIETIIKINSIELEDEFIKNEYKMIHLVTLIAMNKIDKKEDYAKDLSSIIGTQEGVLFVFKPFLKHIVKREIALSQKNLESKNFADSSMEDSLLQYVIILKPSNLQPFFRRIKASSLFDSFIINIIDKKKNKKLEFDKSFDYYKILKCKNSTYKASIWDKKEPKFKLIYSTNEKIYFDDFIYKRESIIDIKCNKL